ncbi:MAG: hypothetical protein ACRBHB_20075 [Arenicella sp.]
MKKTLFAVILLSLSCFSATILAQVSNDLISVNTWDELPAQNYSQSGTVSIAGSRSASAAIYINGQLRVTENTGLWNVSFPGLVDGLHEYQIVGVDAQGEPSESINISIFVDTTAPVVTGLSPSSDNAVTQPLSQFSLLIDETGSGVNIDTSLVYVYPEVGSPYYCQTTDTSRPCWLSTNATNGSLVVNFLNPLLDGKYSINLFHVYDLAGNRQVGSGYDYYVNTTNVVPVGEIATLKQAPELNYQALSYFTIEGERYPQTAVFINGQQAVALGSGDWSHELPEMPEGENSIRIKWVDAQDNSSDEVEYILFVDSTLPEITGVSPANNSVLTEPLAQFSISINETGSGIDIDQSRFYIIPETGSPFWCNSTNASSSCWLSLNAAGDQISVNFNTPLADGAYEVSSPNSYVYDLSGNSKRLDQSINYYVNTSGVIPVAEITDVFNRVLKLAPDLNYQTNNSVTIKGSRFPQTAVVINDQEVVQLGLGDWSYEIPTLSEGENSIRIKWVDAQDNSSEELEYILFVDTVLPEINGVTPVNNSVLTEPLAQLSISVNETGSGVDINQSRFYIISETDGPFWCNSTDTSHFCWLSLNAAGDQISVNFNTPLADGAYEVNSSNAYVVDFSGNAKRLDESIYYYVNTSGTVPVAEVKDPFNRVLKQAPELNYITSNSYSIKGKRYPQTAVVINDQVAIATGIGDWNYALPGLAEGENSIRIKWVDAQGNSSEEIEYLLFVDTVSPNLIGLNPPDNGEYPQLGEFSVLTDEVGSGFSQVNNNTSVAIYKDGNYLLNCVPSHASNQCVIVGGESEVIVKLPYVLGVGEYDLIIRVRDNAGHYTVHQDLQDELFRFTITGIDDSEPPTKPTLSAYDPIVNQAQVTLSGTKEQYSYIVIDGEQQAEGYISEDWSFDVPLEPGPNQINILARDFSGNESESVQANVTFNNTPPGEVSFTASANDDGRSIGLDWSAYDEFVNGADIADYLLYATTEPLSELRPEWLRQTIQAGNANGVITGLTSGETYNVTVVARDQAQQVSDSFTVSQLTLIDSQSPYDIRELVAINNSQGILLSWQVPQYNEQDIDLYRVFVNDTAIADVPVGTLQYQLDGLSAQSLYMVKVVTIDTSANQSDGVIKQVATEYANPIDVTVTASSNAATLSWSGLEPIAGVQRYKVYTSTAPFTDINGMTAATTAINNAQSISVGGLSNGQTYYLAVTAENILGFETPTVQTVSVIPQADTNPPVIDSVSINGAVFVEGQTVSADSELCVQVSDESAISRVDYHQDGSFAFTSSQSAAGFCYQLIADSLVDGVHQLEAHAFDIYDNTTSQKITFDMQLATPVAPVISSPVSGLQTGQALITVSGNTQPNVEVQVTIQDQTSDWFSADASGQFSVDTSLVEDGDNSITVKARNRAGEGLVSNAVVVTLDRSLPSRPLGLVAQTLDSGEVRLEWSVNSLTGIAGFDLYRSTQNFDMLTSAVKINPALITDGSFNDLLIDDGRYYYRVVSVNDLGTLSEPSAIVSIDADATPPVAEYLRYSSAGVFDDQSQTYGVGELSIELRVSEPLLTTPFLSISPDGGAPINVVLTPVSNNQLEYTGTITLDTSAGDGVAFAVFSARDKAGNRGTDVLEGAQINIDTQGPQVINVTTTPETPIKNDQSNPVTLTAVFDLDEVIANTSSFELSYRLSGDNRQPTLINDVVKLEDKKWQAAITLPANAGLNEPELISFTFNAQDDLGNVGSAFNREYVTQIYQGDLPPLATPFNFRGSAIAAGKVKLEWFVVEGAIAYQLYRKAPGEAGLTEYARVNIDGYHEDTPQVDGEYEYKIASIRSANGVESISATSNSVIVSTDSVPPTAPSNLTLELTPIGIQTRWDPVADPDVRYRLYRDASGPIVTTDGLEPLLVDLVEPFVVDTKPMQSQPAYTVVTVDAVGNESEPAETVYLNVDLLPIASIDIRLEQGGFPAINWTHSSNSINNFDIYLGADNTGVKLNGSLLDQTNFVDTAYSNGQRQYAIVAIDDNNQQSLARSLILPKVAMSIAEGQTVKRNLINKVAVRVENEGAAAVQNARIKFVAADTTVQSGIFSLAAGENQIVELTVPGLSDLPDQWNVSLELHSSPNAGETVQIAQPASLSVFDGTLGLRFETDEFIRGADGQFNFTLSNTGEEQIQLITASNFGNKDSQDVVFTLVDVEDNVLALLPFRQALGEGVVNTISGDVLANIDAGQQWTSKQLQIPVPDNAPNEVYLMLQINNLYANRGTSEQVRVKGPKLRQLISLEETPYTGSVDSIAPATSFGKDPILIKGKALDRETQAPLANTDLKIIVEVSGFEREFEVITGETGAYELSYQPQTGESGRYTVSALHPVLTSRPNDGEFVINHLIINPERWNLNIPYLYDYDLNLAFKPGDGTVLTDLRFELRAQDQPTGEVPAGINLTYPNIALLSDEKSVHETIVVRAESEADANGQFFISVFSAESPDEPIGLIDVIYTLSEAKPAIFHSPSVLELGSKLDGVASGSIKIENRGLTALKDVNLALKTHDGFPAPEWLKLITPANVGDIALDEEKIIDIQMQPNNAAPEGVQQLFLEISSSNAPVYFAPIFTVITLSGEGSALFKVTDMYTGTLDGQGRLIQGLPNAKVRLQNEVIPSIQYALVTDELGEVLLEDIPAGRYSAWITSDNYQEEHVRLRIQPGLINSQQVFLDYNLIRLEWSVSEITIEDKYEIVLSATFETDVPAAVVMLEPTNIPLPEMEPGDVLYGELSLTNYGLIRAFDVTFTPQQSDEFYQFEYLNSVVPGSLEAKQVVVIPYKITALKSLEQQDGSGGAGCGAYAKCATSQCKSRCPTGVSEAGSASCVNRSYGSCPAGEPNRHTGGGGGDGGGFGGGGGGFLPLGTGMQECRGDGTCPEGK